MSALVDLRWVVGNDVLRVRQVLDIFVVEPLDLEVQVHVVRALTQPVFLMVCRYKEVDQIDGEGRGTERRAGLVLT